MVERPARPLHLALAFGAVYLIWGSTYLAIRIAIETLPPFLMAGGRFVIAGSLLYVWMRRRGASRPAPRHWLGAGAVGGLLLLGGNGGVVWAEQTVPSGLAALLVAIVPLWMVLLDWLRPGDTRPAPGVLVGLVAGFAGVALLVGPGGLAGGRSVDPAGAGVLLVASLSWAAGSLYSRGAPLPPSRFLAIAMEMLAGGVLLLAAGTVSGEWARLDLAHTSLRSALAVSYLIAFGSLVGFTAYLWLLGATTPARAATYAYVNPVVAVILGSAFAGEPITPRIIVSAAVIVAAVVVITTSRAVPKPRAAVPARAPVEGGAGGAP